MAGAPIENTNAEKWTLEEATELFNNALDKSVLKDYDFIGEIARDLDTYRDVFTYLVDKFPILKDTHKRILSNLEANCFSHTKKGEINVAVGIVNLKSNHGWTDRNDITTKGDKVESNIDSMSTEELVKRAKAIKQIDDKA
jgi:hypothetical protein